MVSFPKWAGRKTRAIAFGALGLALWFLLAIPSLQMTISVFGKGAEITPVLIILILACALGLLAVSALIMGFLHSWLLKNQLEVSFSSKLAEAGIFALTFTLLSIVLRFTVLNNGTQLKTTEYMIGGVGMILLQTFFFIAGTYILEKIVHKKK